MHMCMYVCMQEGAWCLDGIHMHAGAGGELPEDICMYVGYVFGWKKCAVRCSSYTCAYNPFLALIIWDERGSSWPRIPTGFILVVDST